MLFNYCLNKHCTRYNFRSRHKKAQSSLQFMVLLGFVFTVFIIYIGYQGNKIISLENDKEYVLTKDLALKIASELNLATSLEDGYTRSFELPQKLDDVHDYSILDFQTEIVVNTSKQDYSVAVPAHNGTLVKGNNTIVLKSGIICINGGC